MDSKSSELMYTPIGDKGMYGKIDIGKVTFLFVLSGKHKNYVNITKICRAYNKKFTDWYKLDSSKSLMELVSEQLSIKKLYTQFTKVPISGYYVHPILLPHIGLWLDNQATLDIYLFLEKYNKLSNTKLISANRRIKLYEKLTKKMEERCDTLDSIIVSLEKQLNSITDKYNIIVSKNETMANVMRVCSENLIENTKDSVESEHDSESDSSKISSNKKHCEEESDSDYDEESDSDCDEESDSECDEESDSDKDCASKKSVKIPNKKADLTKDFVCGLYKKIDILDGGYNYYFATSYDSLANKKLKSDYEELFLYTSNNKKYINKCKNAADVLTKGGNLDFKNKVCEGPFRYAWTYNEREMVEYYERMYRKMHK